MSEEKKKYMELSPGNTKGKLPYEKPAMKAIALFADQVLNTCGKVNPSGGFCQTDGSQSGKES